MIGLLAATLMFAVAPFSVSAFTCVDPRLSCNANGVCAPDGLSCMCALQYATFPNDAATQCNYARKSRFWAQETLVSLPGLFGAHSAYLEFENFALGKMAITLFAVTWFFCFMCVFRLRAFFAWMCCLGDLQRVSVLRVLRGGREDVEMAASGSRVDAAVGDAADFDFIVLKGKTLAAFWFVTSIAVLAGSASVGWLIYDWFQILYQTSFADANGVNLGP
jgi:hypothetical protein